MGLFFLGKVLWGNCGEKCFIFVDKLIFADISAVRKKPRFTVEKTGAGDGTRTHRDIIREILSLLRLRRKLKKLWGNCGEFGFFVGKN